MSNFDVHLCGSFSVHFIKTSKNYNPTWMFLNPARIFQFLSRVPSNMERIIAKNRLAEKTIQSMLHEVPKIYLLS